MLRARAAAVLLSAGVCLGLAAPAAAENDEAFFRQVAGQWTGPGEIVAGKYKGTKFVCTFDGLPHSGRVGVALDGSCRVGVFAQKMRAELTQSGKSYTGRFQDGSEGNGLDIVSGSVAGDKIVVGLDRKQLKGAMVARLAESDKLAITVSVRVAGELVPVLGMNLDRIAGSTKQTALEQ